MITKMIQKLLWSVILCVFVTGNLSYADEKNQIEKNIPQGIGGRKGANQAFNQQQEMSKLIDQLGAKHGWQCDEAVEKLSKIGKPAVKPLIRALEKAVKEKNITVRLYAAAALGKLKAKESVPTMIKALKQVLKDQRGKTSIIEAVAKLKDARALGLFIQVLKDPDTSNFTRKYIVRGLVAIGKPSVDELIKISDNPNKDVRRHVVKALGAIKDARALPVLFKALNDKDDWVRRASADVFYEYIHDKRATMPLIKMMNNEEEGQVTRSVAANALERIKDPGSIDALIKQSHNPYWPQLRDSAIHALKEIGEPAIPKLINTIKTGDYSAREAASYTLLKIGKPAIGELIKLLKSTNVDVRDSAVTALGHIKDKAVVKPLIAQLEKDSSEKVRKNIVFFLCNYVQDPESISALVKALGDKSQKVRKAASDWLYLIGKPAIPFLAKALKHENIQVRLGAVNTLGKIKDQTALTQLITALNDKEPLARKTVVKMLGSLETKDRKIVTALIQALADKNAMVRKQAASGLADSKEPRVVTALIKASKDENKSVRGQAVKALGGQKDKSAVEALIHSVDDKDITVQKTAISALAKTNNPKAIVKLIDLTQDEDKRLRKQAVDALWEIKDKTVTTALIIALSDEDPEIQKLAIYGLKDRKDTRIVPALVDLLESRGENIPYEELISVLGNFKDQRAIPALIEAVKDKKLRSNALWALADYKGKKAFGALIELLDKNPEPAKDVVAQFVYSEWTLNKLVILAIEKNKISLAISMCKAIKYKIVFYNFTDILVGIIDVFKKTEDDKTRVAVNNFLGEFSSDQLNVETFLNMLDHEDEVVRIFAAIGLANFRMFGDNNIGASLLVKGLILSTQNKYKVLRQNIVMLLVKILSNYEQRQPLLDRVLGVNKTEDKGMDRLELRKISRIILSGVFKLFEHKNNNMRTAAYEIISMVPVHNDVGCLIYAAAQLKDYQLRDKLDKKIQDTKQSKKFKGFTSQDIKYLIKRSKNLDKNQMGFLISKMPKIQKGKVFGLDKTDLANLEVLLKNPVTADGLWMDLYLKEGGKKIIDILAEYFAKFNGAYNHEDLFKDTANSFARYVNTNDKQQLMKQILDKASSEISAKYKLLSGLAKQIEGLDVEMKSAKDLETAKALDSKRKRINAEISKIDISKEQYLDNVYVLIAEMCKLEKKDKGYLKYLQTALTQKEYEVIKDLIQDLLSEVK